MVNMTLRSVAEACGGTLYGEYGIDKEILGVELDSRKLQAGYLFIAVKGERVDGHSFIPQAFAKGCYGVVCEYLPEETAGPCIVVKDSLKALQDIAAFYREQLNIKVVGITGSVGKTSTKEVIASMLCEKYNVLKTEGNFNNEIGLPLTVLKIRREHQVAVLEMGINHFGEMRRLSRIAKPDVCVITNIGQCHLEFLGDRNGILKAKTEMFEFMNPDGVVCLNGDDDKLVTVKEVYGRSPLFFGMGETCDIRAVHIQNHGLYGCEAEIEEKGTTDIAKWNICIPVPGEHMVMNALAAVAVGKTLGMSREEMAAGIAKTESVGGRSHIIRDSVFTIIDDCYNANPVSMKAAVELLDTASTRKVAVLGDMFELGKEEKELHREVGNFIAKKNIDVVIAIGCLAEEIYLAARQGNRNCYYYRSKEEMLREAPSVLQKGDTILLKASHGMGFTELVEFCSAHTWI